MLKFHPYLRPPSLLVSRTLVLSTTVTYPPLSLTLSGPHRIRLSRTLSRTEAFRVVGVMYSDIVSIVPVDIKVVQLQSETEFEREARGMKGIKMRGERERERDIYRKG